MGMIYEMNWYLVTEEKISLKAGVNYNILKNDVRIYPIDMPIPLIIKNVGCVGMVTITKLSICKTVTTIDFKCHYAMCVASPVAEHYYRMYTLMKKDIKEEERETTNVSVLAFNIVITRVKKMLDEFRCNFDRRTFTSDISDGNQELYELRRYTDIYPSDNLYFYFVKDDESGHTMSRLYILNHEDKLISSMETCKQISISTLTKIILKIMGSAPKGDHKIFINDILYHNELTKLGRFSSDIVYLIK